MINDDTRLVGRIQAEAETGALTIINAYATYAPIEGDPLAERITSYWLETEDGREVEPADADWSGFVVSGSGERLLVTPE